MRRIFLLFLLLPLAADAAQYVPARAAAASGVVTFQQIDHDQTTNFVLNEHLDWTADLGATDIHANNIPDLSGTYQPLDALLTSISGLTGLTGNDIYVVTGTAGTNGNCAEWNADGDLVDAGAACSAGGGASQLSDLSDVNTSTPTTRNVLVADGVDFESRALVEADISDLGAYLTAEVNNLESGGAEDIASTEVFVGTGAGTGNYTALSGDVTMDNAGAVTIANDAVEPNMVQSSGQTDEFCLTYEATGTTWEWQTCAAASFTDIDTDYGNETVTSDWVFQGASATGGKGAWDLTVGNGSNYGGLRIGDSGWYRSTYSSVNLDLDGAMTVWNEGNLGAGNDPGIEFAIMEDSNSMRFAIPESGSDNATAMIRSVTIAGPYTSTIGNDVVSCDQWSAYDTNIDCDTSGTGADLFVQDDIEVEGTIFAHETINMEGSTADGHQVIVQVGADPGADVTLTLPTSTGTLVTTDGLADTVAEITDLDDDAATLSLPASTTITAFGATLVDDADAATARTTLDVDQTGTDNSTDVTLAGTPDYITIAGQVITRTQVDLTADVTGELPDANVANAITVSVQTASKSANYTVGTDDSRESYGGVIYVTSAATITLPAIATGMKVSVATIGATAVSVDTNASDRMYLDGTALDDGDKATNTSTAGDVISCTYESAAGWWCMSGSPDGDKWTDGGA